MAQLADEFYRELRHFIRQAADKPNSFAIRERDRELCCAHSGAGWRHHVGAVMGHAIALVDSVSFIEPPHDARRSGWADDVELFARGA